MFMNFNSMTDYYRSKRILITGAAGFLGSNLLNHFIADGIEVNILIRPSTNMWRISTSPLINVYYADLTNYKETLKVLKQIKPQVLFHIASTGGHPSEMQNFQQFHSDNIAITSNLLEASVICEIEKFVFSGSSLEGEIQNNKVYESYAFQPTTFRGITKATETMLCNYYAQTQNLNTINVRIFSVYGPFENSRRVVPQLILRFLNKERVSLIPGNFKRDFVFVDDVTDCLLLSGSSDGVPPGTIINIGTGFTHSPYEIYERLSCIFGYTVPINPEPYPIKAIDTTPYSADLVNLDKLLGWVPRYSFDMGLSKTVDWFAQNYTLYE